MGDLMEQTKSEVRRLRQQLERQEDENESHTRRTTILSIVLAVLLLLLGGATWAAYPALREGQKAAVGMLGLQTTANSLGDQLKAVEAKADNVTGLVPALTSRMDQLEAGMKSTVQAARTQAQAAATQVGERLRADINVSIQAIQSRLSGVESNQREASAHVAQLEDQIAGLKRELASMRDESSSSIERIKKLQEDQQAQTSAMSGLDQRMTSSQSTIESISGRMMRMRVEFEMQSKKPEQIAPGYFLTIKRIDTGKQEVDATLEVAADSRVLTIRGQGIQKPAVFYTSADSRPIELVFTDITRNKITGYVLMPGAGDSPKSVEQAPAPRN
jgi:chromosome segregation ATPase